VRWIENWLNGGTQRIVVSSAESSWRPVTSSGKRSREKYNRTVYKLNITEKLFYMSEKLLYIQSWKTLI